MYAILIVDALAEKSSVMSTLAADDLSAAILMMTTAEGWMVSQEVNLEYSMIEELPQRRIIVMAGTSIVLTITAQPIDSVIGAPELRSFCKPERGPH